jgi:hypothetical protein
MRFISGVKSDFRTFLFFNQSVIGKIKKKTEKINSNESSKKFLSNGQFHLFLNSATEWLELENFRLKIQASKTIQSPKFSNT